MDCKAEYIDYHSTGYFSKIVTDYISADLKPGIFYKYPPDFSGIHQAIDLRKNFSTDREILVQQLLEQYNNLPTSDSVKKNIASLLNEDTFTICTAHQPNIFTGHLYFIYKILHTIKLSEDLKKHFPDKYFVPVFYMGSEDADIEELGNIYLNGETHYWNTNQAGAVGRMKIDDDFLKIISTLEGTLSVLPNGNELLAILKKSYTKNTTIQQSTFILLNKLFASYGLIILIPDNGILKAQMQTVFEDDLYNHTANKIVSKTNKQLAKNYKEQAHPRDINLFYLKDDVRNRITKNENDFFVDGTSIKFSKEEIQKELNQHPERFSPNVILRGLFQEKILPNVAFIGGGGELAYWLQTKQLFENYNIPFPVLILRNSFLIIEKRAALLMQKLNLSTKDIFSSEIELANKIVAEQTKQNLSLSKQSEQLSEIYSSISEQINTIDKSLQQHTEALRTKALHGISALEKKMLKAEKRKYSDKLNQLKKLCSMLFPKEQLQERVENFMPYYARHGEDFFKTLYQFSKGTDQQFCIITEQV